MRDLNTKIIVLELLFIALNLNDLSSINQKHNNKTLAHVKKKVKYSVDE